MSKQLYKAIDPTQVDKPILSPADMLAIEDDPSKMETVARMLGAVNLDNLFRHMQNPTINPMARIEFQKMLNKLGRLEPDTKADVGKDGLDPFTFRSLNSFMRPFAQKPRDFSRRAMSGDGAGYRTYSGPMKGRFMRVYRLHRIMIGTDTLNSKPTTGQGA